MIIKELYVDHFLGNDDLTLADLSDQLNVIRVPSQVEAESLRAFLPSMLYGEAEHDERTSGSALVQIGDRLYELLRIVDGEMPGLHILDEQGETTDCPLEEWLTRITEQTYLSVFTDRLLIPARLEQWRVSELMSLLVDESRPAAAKPTVDESLLVDEVRRLADRVERLIQQRIAILIELASGPDAREEYLAARAKVGEAEQRVQQTRAQLERSRRQIQAIEHALQLVKPWTQQAKLQSQIEELRALRVRPKDLKRLQLVERQLAQARVRLRELRERVDQPPTAEPQVHRFDPELQRLLGQREEVLHRLRRLDELEQELLDAAQAEQRERESVVEAVKQVKDAAGRLRQARRRFRTATEQTGPQMARDGSRDPSFTQSPDGTEQPSVDEIRERIKQLKVETHQLLKRRMLPPPIVLALGAVFAIGTTCLMASLLLDLRGFDTSVGAIGVTGMLASALLKLSFERPPNQQLRAHRTRIQQLLQEVEQRNLADPAVTPAEDSMHLPLDESIRPRVIRPTSDGPPSDPVELRQQMRQELEDAYQEWVGLVGQYDLEADSSPSDAVAEVRRRYSEQSNLRPDQASTLQREHEEQSRWLDRYRDAVIAFLAARQHKDEWPRWQEVSWEELLRRLDAEDQGAVPEPTPAADLPCPEPVVDVQRQIKELKRAREKILDRAGVADANELISQLERQEQLSDVETDLHRVQQRISRELSDIDGAAEVERLLSSKTEADLKKQRSRKQTEVKRISTQLEEAQTDLDGALHAVHTLSTDPTKIDLRLQLKLIDQQLIETAAQWRVAQVGRRAIVQLQPTPPGGGKPSCVLQEASRLLQTCRRVPCHLLCQDGQFLLVDESQHIIPLRELARNDAELIVMCLQVALVQYLRDEAGIRLPLVLGEQSLGYPAEHALQIGQLLTLAASQGTQSFLFTCHEAVSDLFNQLGVPTLVLERTVAADELEATFDPEAASAIEVGSMVDSPKPDAVSEPVDADWIPVEYYVVETRDAREVTSSDRPRRRDPTRSTALPTTNASPTDELATRLDQVADSTSGKSKRFRVDRAHHDRPTRTPTPRRRSISASEDELPEWWPD